MCPGASRSAPIATSTPTPRRESCLTSSTWPPCWRIWSRIWSGPRGAPSPPSLSAAGLPACWRWRRCRRCWTGCGPASRWRRIARSPWRLTRARWRRISSLASSRRASTVSPSGCRASSRRSWPGSGAFTAPRRRARLPHWPTPSSSPLSIWIWCTACRIRAWTMLSTICSRPSTVRRRTSPGTSSP